MKLYIYNNGCGDAAINLDMVSSIFAYGKNQIGYSIPGCVGQNNMTFQSKEDRDQVLADIIKQMQGNG